MGISTNEEILRLFPGLEETLVKDLTHNTEEALMEIYKKMRPGEPLQLENAQKLMYDLFLIPVGMTWVKSDGIR